MTIHYIKDLQKAATTIVEISADIEKSENEPDSLGI
jgi:hypothetical protein